MDLFVDFPCKPETRVWLESLQKSSMINYIKCVKNFRIYCTIHPEWDIQRNFHNYFLKLHDDKFAASSMITIHSELGKFYKKDQNCDLESNTNATMDVIKNWRKHEVVKQSKV